MSKWSFNRILDHLDSLITQHHYDNNLLKFRAGIISISEISNWTRNEIYEAAMERHYSKSGEHYSNLESPYSPWKCLIGDKVKVINNATNHNQPVGTLLTIREPYTIGDYTRGWRVKENTYWYGIEDLEKVK